MDGGATDVSILGPMELKKMHFCFIIRPTCWLQNFFRIENRTIISWDTATFVQEGQTLHISLENNPQKYVFQFFFQPNYRLEIFQIGKKYLIL